jgi:hypothetical protein
MGEIGIPPRTVQKCTGGSTEEKFERRMEESIGRFLVLRGLQVYNVHIGKK